MPSCSFEQSSQKRAFVTESDLPSLMFAIGVLVSLCIIYDHHEIMICV